ncbi:LLM class F420-dependent oxidoreductase [Actinorhabdospora filicis]|uniref:LLM class F420-dependent oxidoreductase n=1 Tax=Actinorhabdospora filicis TaxID=1785913 RepID=A0A9W6SJC6_9ACTN|nr:LLM class flavin-dependent oxidoreductase [Actinorhabdospora filicis]GLZ76681.1 LLM class F420-dependent oxidoreductase [Actinorhabdospora filicis]
MAYLGYGLTGEDFAPGELLDQARRAEDAGFTGLRLTGRGPSAWPMTGAISRVCRLPVTTTVTCPDERLHPVALARAAATSAVLLGNRFALGLDPAPGRPPEELEEAVDLVRKLWTGKPVDHHGEYYTVENERLETLPDLPSPLYLSGTGMTSIALAGRIADGFISAEPEAETLRLFREFGGQDKITQGFYRVCWAPTEAEATALAHASHDATPVLVCGPDPARHLAAFRRFADAGFDEVFVANIGPYQREFFELYRTEVIPGTR